MKNAEPCPKTPNRGARHRLYRLLPGALLAAALGASAEAADYVDLQVGITGSNNLTGLDDPVTVARLDEVSPLLQDLADAPRSAQFIDNALAGSSVDRARLVNLGLIRLRGDQYVISFPYYTAEDHERLMSGLAPFAESLAGRYLARADEFDALFAQYDVDSVPRGAVAYANLGAMSLDWDGLSITQRLDLRTSAENLPQGRDFVIWAKESVSPDSLMYLYWGTHNEQTQRHWFTTFGDHAPGRRIGLPDYLWNVGRAIVLFDDGPTPLSRAAQRALQPYYFGDALTAIGDVLLALRNGANTIAAIVNTTGLEAATVDGLVAFLAELQYVRADDGRFELLVPVFSLDDMPMIESARKLSAGIIETWLAENYDPSQEALSGLTMMEYGMSYRDLYTQIWHYLFGMVNHDLVKAGFFADPRAPARSYQGFLPFMFELGTYVQYEEFELEF